MDFWRRGGLNIEGDRVRFPFLNLAWFPLFVSYLYSVNVEMWLLENRLLCMVSGREEMVNFPK